MSRVSPRQRPRIRTLCLTALGALCMLTLAACHNTPGMLGYMASGGAASRGVPTLTPAMANAAVGAVPPIPLIYPKPAEEPKSTEEYARIEENGFQAVVKEPLSTFAIDVDTASYSNVRRMLNEKSLPPKDAVRIEEMVNYFTYDYPEPKGAPISLTTEVAQCPWNKNHQLVRIGLRGRSIPRSEMPPRNFVFLIDVSGSMSGDNRLPLVKKSLDMLAEQLSARDRVAIVTYAGDAGLKLPSTPGNNYQKISKVLKSLNAGGSTHGSEGIQLAYKVAQESFIPGGLNRVILATDGDFNVGVTSQDELVKLIEEKRKSNIYLTILGFGMGNLRDATMEKLADHGNGHYAYIDSEKEARRVFVEQGAALITIAKDVRVQVEFNPRHAASYRLVGYENRLMEAKDFNNDKKDAGEMGAGHTVTALYEVVPAGSVGGPGVDPLKYQKTPLETTTAAESNELLTIKVRYKEPEAETSQLITLPVLNSTRPFADATTDFRFAASVATFGMLLRDSPHKGEMTYAKTAELARGALGRDGHGHRAEFVRLVEAAGRLAPETPAVAVRR